MDFMATILFATGNQRKINEANDTLESFGVTVEPISIEFDEIQHHNPSEITKAKARAAYAILSQPVVVSDTSWSIPALGGFPGGYMRDVGIWWSEQDWLNIMAGHDDKTIICQEHLAYYDGRDLVHFSQEYEGTFLSQIQGPIVNEKESFERVASLDGKNSLAEGQANRILNGEKKQLAHWQKFGEWLNSK
jgi:non-canonical purine NTP pyrophosphatase (RdgB/HAM1 family)